MIRFFYKNIFYNIFIMEEYEYLKNFDNLYKINKKGDIYSCHFQRNMRGQINENNYNCVHLTKNGKVKKYKVHRLVAMQWLENTENKPHIDHIDRNKNNNSLDNLRWATAKENAHNRANYYKNLTNEQLEERKRKKKEVRKIWEKKYRLKKLNKNL